MSVGTELDQAVDALRDAEKLLLTTHENPDGDALGSLIGMQALLLALGKDSLMFMPAAEFPLPHEYRTMPLEGVIHDPPPDLGERLVVFLDCGNIDRMPADFLENGGREIVNIDHHHDNTRFGTVNLVDAEASCTAEIVWRLAAELGVEVDLPMAEALYVGLVTDTGRFQYENTSPRAHRMAAELVEAGVSPHAVYRRLWEDLPQARLELLGRALRGLSRVDGGVLTIAHLTREDYLESGAVESDTEGAVDHLRTVAGTKVACVVRDLLGEDRADKRKVSLRATDGTVDVSRIARAHGGGGHRQAAGFTTELEFDALVERLRAELADQLQ